MFISFKIWHIFPMSWYIVANDSSNISREVLSLLHYSTWNTVVLQYSTCAFCCYYIISHVHAVATTTFHVKIGRYYQIPRLAVAFHGYISWNIVARSHFTWNTVAYCIISREVLSLLHYSTWNTVATTISHVRKRRSDWSPRATSFNTTPAMYAKSAKIWKYSQKYYMQYCTEKCKKMGGHRSIFWDTAF